MTKQKNLLKAFIGTAGFQLFGSGLTVIAGIIFARVLGPEEFGKYSFVFSIIIIATIPVIAGMPQLIIRETARYLIESKYSLILGILRWSVGYLVVASAVSIMILIICVKSNVWEPSVGILIILAISLVPMRGMLLRYSAIFNGLHRPEIAQFPGIISVPLFSIILFIILFLNDYQLSSKIAIFIQIIAHSASVLICWLLLSQALKKQSIHGQPDYQVSRWYQSLLPFTILAIVTTMNFELTTVFLGFLGSEEAIGYFKVAVQGVSLLTLGLQAINTVSGPRIASFYKKNQLKETQVLLNKIVKISVITSLPFVIILIYFGDLLISLLFGDDYLPATNLIAILCIGQMVNVCMGSVGLVLNMTGNEKYSLRALSITLVITVVLLLLLIPSFEATGAAIAVSIGLISWNLLMAIDVYRLTGLKTWIRF